MNHHLLKIPTQWAKWLLRAHALKQFLSWTPVAWNGFNLVVQPRSGSSHANNYHPPLESPLCWPLEGNPKLPHSLWLHSVSVLGFFTLTAWVFFSPPQRKWNHVYTVDVCHAPPHVFNKIHMTSGACFCIWCLHAVFPALFACLFLYCCCCHLFSEPDHQIWTSVFSIVLGCGHLTRIFWQCRRHQAGDGRRGRFKSCTLSAIRRAIHEFGGLKYWQ